MAKCTIIDPPSGWMYGFPKKLDLKENETVNEFLLRNGYPQDLIEQWTDGDKQVPCRYWEHEDV